jgi:acetyl esterase
MAEPTSTRPGIDPALKDLLDAFPLQIRVADGVEAARQKMRQIEPPADLLPTMRIEERTIGFDDLTDIPVRVYWPPIPAHDDLPVVVFYHGGGWAIVVCSASFNWACKRLNSWSPSMT